MSNAITVQFPPHRLSLYPACRSHIDQSTLPDSTTEQEHFPLRSWLNYGDHQGVLARELTAHHVPTALRCSASPASREYTAHALGSARLGRSARS